MDPVVESISEYGATKYEREGIRRRAKGWGKHHTFIGKRDTKGRAQ